MFSTNKVILLKLLLLLTLVPDQMKALKWLTYRGVNTSRVASHSFGSQDQSVSASPPLKQTIFLNKELFFFPTHVFVHDSLLYYFTAYFLSG